VLTGAPTPRRLGTTLVELLVALTVGGIALGIIAAIGVREQRAFHDLAESAAAAGQLRDAASILPGELRGIAPAAGDIRAGEARDTSLELRATIGSAVVCDTNANSLILAPPAAGSESYAGFATPIEAGDTAWLFSPADTGGDWLPFQVAATSGTAAGACLGPAPYLTDSARTLARVAVSLAPSPPLGPALGLPVRFTRPRRYDLYRAADGLSYLGERDWNNATRKFDAVQPVSGPFLSAAASGPAFRYLDSTGAVLATPVASLGAVALVQVDLHGQTHNSSRAAGLAGETTPADSARVVILLHNRR
jgi:hypothetical protein